MAKKPSYEQLEQGIKELQKEALKHKRTKETLEASAKKYRALVSNSPDIIYILDPKGNFSFVAGAIEILLGFKAEELIGKHFTSIIWPEDVKKAEWRFNERRTGERSTKRFQLRLITDQGKGEHFDIKYLPVELYTFGVYDKPVSAKDKKFLGTYGVARDIADRKQAEEAYRTLVDQSLQGLLIIQDMRIVFANTVFAKTLGYTNEELLLLSPEKVRAMIHAEDQALVWGRFRNQLEGKLVPPNFECRGVRKNGAMCWLEMVASRIHYRRKPAIQGAIKDVTARKQAEKALRESEERYRLIFETAANLITSINKEGIIVDCNSRIQQFLSYGPGEIIGQSMAKIIHPEYLEKAQNSLNEILTNGFSLNKEYKMVRKDGSQIDVNINSSGLKDEKGECVRTICIIEDITTRKRTEAQIRASLKEKEVLLREVHHRVKNNLQVISSLLDMRAMRTDNQEVIDFFEDTRSKIHTMALIHTQLYRSERFDRIDMGGHIRELVEYLSRIYITNSGSISTVIEAQDVYLSVTQAIPCALVLNELVSNAFKHAFKDGQKGTIEISLKIEDHNKIFLKVKDNGRGFPEEIDILKTNSLGLKLMRNTVQDQLMGKIHIERGVGTTIIVEFKILEEEVNHVQSIDCG